MCVPDGSIESLWRTYWWKKKGGDSVLSFSFLAAHWRAQTRTNTHTHTQNNNHKSIIYKGSMMSSNIYFFGPLPTCSRCYIFHSWLGNLSQSSNYNSPPWSSQHIKVFIFIYLFFLFKTKKMVDVHFKKEKWPFRIKISVLLNGLSSWTQRQQGIGLGPYRSPLLCIVLLLSYVGRWFISQFSSPFCPFLVSCFE